MKLSTLSSKLLLSGLAAACSELHDPSSGDLAEPEGGKADAPTWYSRGHFLGYGHAETEGAGWERDACFVIGRQDVPVTMPIQVPSGGELDVFVTAYQDCDRRGWARDSDPDFCA